MDPTSSSSFGKLPTKGSKCWILPCMYIYTYISNISQHHLKDPVIVFMLLRGTMAYKDKLEERLSGRVLAPGMGL